MFFYINIGQKEKEGPRKVLLKAKQKNILWRFMQMANES
jgi:hypothetical protein